MTVSLRAILLYGVFLLPGTVHGSGFYVPDSGTVARSRGGAFCVAADDPMAMRYNPAGLADQRGRALLLDLSSV